MNKGRRNELTLLKYRKRLKQYRLNVGDWFALKSHGSPCSCSICKGEKYREKRQKNKRINFEK